MSELVKEGRRRALISVSNKNGLVKLAQELVKLDYHLVSTGGTSAALADAGVPVEKVEDLTGFPEILGGRVKTLHPKVHAGILARDLPEDRAQLEKLQIEPFDLVVVNLYPFEETVARPDTRLQDAIEQIDIGGPSMVRAAAKNFARVTVVVDPADYDRVLAAIRSGGVALSARFELARKAFWHTARYDSAIAGYLFQAEVDGEEDLGRTVEREPFPERINLPLIRVAKLRYGENPHQRAAFYSDGSTKPFGLAGAKQYQGKELSFNNLVDLEAALSMVTEFDQTAAVVIKHGTPSGVACNPDLAEAYRQAREANALAAFGGIVGLNRKVDKTAAAVLAETFLESVAAPGYSEEALEILGKKPNLRLLAVDFASLSSRNFTMKRVSGGYLLQDPDATEDEQRELRRLARVVTKRRPSEEEWRDLIFAWAVVKHVTSNGIVLAKDSRTIGIGGGQVSRVAAVDIALSQAKETGRGAVLASDGFFPFPDSVERAAAAGVKALIEPGGSLKDEEVTTAADRLGLAMVFTGRRHFKH